MPDQKFEAYWRANERVYFRYALRKFSYFHSQDSGEWEDAFSKFARELQQSWPNFRGEASRETWAYLILERVFFRRIAALRQHAAIFTNGGDWSREGEFEDDDLSGIDLPEPVPLIDPVDARNLLAKVGAFVDQCVASFVKSRRDHMAIEGDVKTAFYLKRVDGTLSGKEIEVITGISPSQQADISKSIKKCVTDRALKSGFGAVVTAIKSMDSQSGKNVRKARSKKNVKKVN